MRVRYKHFVAFLGSRTFFYLLMGVFVLSALWLAVSTRYPMAFDEEYHLGLIKLHALDWDPIFRTQPTGVAQYGALTTDPSYLFHYLMSLVYRALDATALTATQIIIVLRILNVALFSSSIVLMRRVMHYTKASDALINTSLLFFTLLPVTPFLAATINYDNLQNVLLAIGLLALLRFREKLLKKQFHFPAFVTFMSVGLLASLVKFTFLPFLTAFAAYLLYGVARYLVRRKNNLGKAFRKEWDGISRTKRIALSLVFLFACGAFLNSYAVNIVKYQNPVPQCGQVVGNERCKAYSPWYRNFLAHQNNKPVNPNPILYTGQWVGGMYNRLLFVINGKAPVDNYQNFMAPFLALVVALVGAFGLILMCIYGFRILRGDSVLTLLLFVSLVYVASVWGRNYHDWLNLKQAVAINGRYLLPVLPFIFLLLGGSYQLFLRGRTKAKALLGSIAFLLFMQGGGITSFMYYSRDSWYWDGNTQIRTMNRAAKRVVSPFFITTYIKAIDHLYQ